MGDADGASTGSSSASSIARPITRALDVERPRAGLAAKERLLRHPRPTAIQFITMNPDRKKQEEYESKLAVRIRAAAAVLALEKRVTAIDVLVGIGWLAGSAVNAWHVGRVPTLVETMQVAPAKLRLGLQILRAWAESERLPEREGSYVARTPKREPLRFSATPDAEIERAFRAEWLAANLGEAAVKRVEKRADTPADLVVIDKGADWVCDKCGADEKRFLIMVDGGPTCIDCAGLGGLEFLAAGDAGLTRTAKKHSARFAVVVKFSRARKRYERQGILVEPAAIRAAEADLASRK